MAQKVAFKMPIEDLRGKLATRQKGIAYEGQKGDNPFYSLDGKRQSTNYSKNIVLYNRRGKSHFFVKSKTGINLSRRQRVAMMYLAVANEMAKYIMADLSLWSSLQAAWRLDARNFVTLRDFVVSSLIPALREGNQDLIIQALDEYGLPVSEGAGTVPVGDNPLNMSGSTCEFASLSSVPLRISAIMLKFYTAYRETLITDTRAFLHVNYNGKVYPIPFGFGLEDIESSEEILFSTVTSSQGNNPGEYNSLLAHKLGLIRESPISHIEIRLYDYVSGKFLAGDEFLPLYNDADKTSPITNDNPITTTDIYYV